MTPEDEQVVRALVGRYDKTTEPPTVAELEQTAKGVAAVFGYTIDLEKVVSSAREKIAHRMGEGVSLVDQPIDHDPNWVAKRKIEWKYTKGYSEFLIQDDWAPKVVETLDAVTRKILSNLQDPTVEGDWDRRGLVIGHVQSGKTANYLGLVARAADAGYRFIVVVAGIHNNLRRQTQERLDEGFVGETSDPERRQKLTSEGKTFKIGVGLNPHHERPVALTTVNDDFTRANSATIRGALADWSRPVVVVIKKNKSTLTALNQWLREFNRKVGQDQIADVPMLFIDDEADNASINVNKKELDPTVTNALIRETLRLFRRSCYVGYTATPFANIFINPEGYGTAYDDLFPRHFIHCLDAPNNYFGADRLFLDADTRARHVRKIDDCEAVLPLLHKKEHDLENLPATLEHAIRCFVIVRAIRSLRGQETKHCSMLVNVSRFVAVQKETKQLVEKYLENLANAVVSNAGLPPKASSANEHITTLKKSFDSEYINSGFEWSEVLAQLVKAVPSVQVVVVNSDSQEGLHYTQYADKGEALNVIAVGGLSLSRGLTLDGLCVSYMYRNTRMYDTLLQMGRWFGYRGGYEDLCRLWLADASVGWYQHISTAAGELRDRIKEMNRVGGTPRKFGLMVQSHPDALTVTAKNKMRHAEEKTLQVSYDGKLVETYVLGKDPSEHEANRSHFSALYRSLVANHSHLQAPPTQRPSNAIWRGIPAEIVGKFLSDFQVHPFGAESLRSARRYLETIRGHYPNWDIGFVSLKNATRSSSALDLGGFSMISQRRSAGRLADGSLKIAPGDGLFVTNNQRVAGPGEEGMGLTDAEMASAKRQAARQDREKPTDRDFRHKDVRGAPLLMLHLIDIDVSDDPNSPKIDVPQAPAIGVSFPATGEFKTVAYVLNKVMLEQMEDFDAVDDDEDFDASDKAA